LQSIAPNSLDVPSICSGTPYSSRRPKISLTRHSVHIVILDPAEHWLDGCIYRREIVPGGALPSWKNHRRGEFSQVVQSDEVTMRLTYKDI
jgi:hypothetical protein